MPLFCFVLRLIPGTPSASQKNTFSCFKPLFNNNKGERGERPDPDRIVPPDHMYSLAPYRFSGTLGSSMEICQLIGSSPADSRYLFARENGRLPKKP